MSEDPPSGNEGESEDPRWRRSKQLFEIAIDLEPANRDAFISEACKDDPELFYDLRTLVDNWERSGDFLNVPAIGNLGAESLSPGVVLINRFCILELLGSGGMGHVYRAEDLDSGEIIALKTIRPEIAREGQNLLRFRREMELARKVSHPNVCKVFALWTAEIDGEELVFLTMELLKGETLAQRLDRCERLSPREAFPIAKQIAAGLDGVHRMGLLHRDVKPSNVFLVRDEDEQERAVVMDFGLARPIVRGAESGEMSRAGAWFGTPAYMAPELFRAQDSSVASDVYSFGVTLYQMLTGRNEPIIAPSKRYGITNGAWVKAICQCIHVEVEKRPKSAIEAIRTIEVHGRRRLVRAVAIASVVLIVALPLASYGVRLWNGYSRPTGLTRVTYDGGLVRELTYSADGKTLVYSSDRENARGNLNLWVQEGSEGPFRRLTRSGWNEHEPNVSSDGQRVVFRSERKPAGLYTVPVKGGEPRFLAPDGHRPKFSPDGKTIAFFTGEGDTGGSLWTIPASGGTPRAVAAGFGDARFPVWSPDGNELLFSGAKLPGLPQPHDLYRVNLTGDAPVATGILPRFAKLSMELYPPTTVWTADSLLFCARSGHATNLFKMPALGGPSEQFGDPIRLTTGSGQDVFPWILPNGEIAFINYRAAVRVLRVPLRRGAQKVEQVLNDDAFDAQPTVSRDDHWLLVRRNTGSDHRTLLHDLWAHSSREIFLKGAIYPSLSSDGFWSSYSKPGKAGIEIWIRENSSGSETKACDACGLALGWLPDSSGLLFLQSGPTAEQDVKLLDRQTHAVSTVLHGKRYGTVSVSSDGHFIAFSASSNGIRRSIYVARFEKGVPSGAEAVCVEDGGTWDDKPQWSFDGEELYFESNQDGFMCLWRVAVDGSGKVASAISPLAHLHHAALSPMNIPNTSYNVSASDNYAYFNAAALSGSIWKLGY